MKKILLVLLAFLLLFANGCKEKKSQDYNPADYTRTYNVVEEYYLELISDILSNPTEYLGSKINIEGMYKKEGDHSYVYRTGPECCYPEGITCGLEFKNSDDSLKEKDWVLVSGTLSYYEENGEYKVILTDCEVKKPENRGLETISHKENRAEPLSE